MAKTKETEDGWASALDDVGTATEPEKLVMLSVHITPNMRKDLKLRAINDGCTVRDLVTRFIEIGLDHG